MKISPTHSTRPIVMLVRAMHGGGAQRDGIELANGLFAAGWPMMIATLDASGPLAARVTPDLPVLDLGHGRKLRLARATGTLRRLIGGLGPQAIIASEAAANVLLVHAAGACPPKRRPRIILREVAAPLQARRADPYLQNRLAYWLAPWFYPRADAVLSLTAGVQRDLVGHFRVPPARAIHLGTNAVLSEARLADLARPLPRDPDHIVAVGRLSPEKDFASLIMAFAVVQDDHPSLRLTILGEGPERPDLERLVIALGLAECVDLPGFVDEPGDLVRQARLFVSSSQHEGFGNAIVEALACGTPVVATDAPHGPREILEDGRLGLLVPLNSLAALAHAIREALAAPVDAAALRARAADYTTERAVIRMAEVFAGLGLTRDRVAEEAP